jgi:hypothetical protein
MSKELVIGGIAIVLAVSALMVGGKDGARGQDGKDGVTVGALPVLSSPIEVEGAQVFYKQVPMVQATTTVCSIRTPNATTSGRFFVRVKTSPTYVTYQVASSLTNPTATTTDIGSFTDGDFVSSGDTVFSPLTFVNVKLGTTTGTTVGSEFNPTGNCGYELRGL